MKHPPVVIVIVGMILAPFACAAAALGAAAVAVAGPGIIYMTHQAGPPLVVEVGAWMLGVALLMVGIALAGFGAALGFTIFTDARDEWRGR